PDLARSLDREPLAGAAEGNLIRGRRRAWLPVTSWAAVVLLAGAAAFHLQEAEGLPLRYEVTRAARDQHRTRGWAYGGGAGVVLVVAWTLQRRRGSASDRC